MREILIKKSLLAQDLPPEEVAEEPAEEGLEGEEKKLDEDEEDLVEEER